MHPKHLIPILGGAGVIAYLVGRSHRPLPKTNPIGATPSGNPLPQPGGVVPPTGGPGGVYSGPWPAASQDVASTLDVDYSKEHHILTADIANGQNGAAVNDAFFRQVWLPASRFKLSSLTDYQTRLAFDVLSGNVHRYPDKEDKYQQFLEEQRQASTQAIAGTVFSAVGSIIPIVGKVFSTVVSAAVSSVNTDVIHSAGAAAGMMNSIHVAVDLKNLDPPAQMLLQPSWNGQGEKRFDMSVAPWVSQAGIQLYDPVFNGQVPAKYRQDLGNICRIDKSPVSTYSAHNRLWNSYQYGIFLPWVCDEFFGPGSTLQDQINSVSAAYKLLDTICCLAFPDTTIRDPNRKGMNYWGQNRVNLYYYTNKYFGDILGTIFPPTDEDTYIQNNNGEILDYNGYPFPILTYVDLANGSATHKTVAPHSWNEWEQDEAQLAAWKAADAANVAANIAKVNTPQHTRYFDTYYMGRNIDSGELWTDIMFSWSDIAVMPLDVMKHLNGAQLNHLNLYNVDPDGKRAGNAALSKVSPDRQALLKQMVVAANNGGAVLM
jgi:hypothetical protein